MLIFAKSAYIPNAVAEGRNNNKAFGFNAHAEGMNGAFVIVTSIKTTINDKTFVLESKEGMYK